MLRFFLFILPVVLISCKKETDTLSAIAPSNSRLDSIRNAIIEQVKSGKTNSFSVAVIHKENILWKESYMRDIHDSTNVIINDNEVYPVASLTKSITSVLAHKLAEKGFLSLDDNIDKYLVDDVEFISGKGIKVKNLLTMKGGIPHGWIFINNNSKYNNLDSKTIYNLYAVSALPVGTYEYSNYSFGILEKVLEKATGEKFSDLIQKEIFEPLNMSDSFLEYKPNLSDTKYIKETKEFSFYPKAAAGVYASLSDLINYSKLHMGKYPNIISNKSINRMHNSKSSELEIMAEGIGNITLKNNQTWLLSNGSFSFPIESNSNLSILPNEEIAIICLADKDYESSADLMAIKIADVFMPEFKKNAFEKMELYESGNNKPFKMNSDSDLFWEGTLSSQGKKIDLYLSYINNVLKYSFDNSEFKDIENLRMDNQNVIRGSIELLGYNPLTNGSKLTKSDINITVSEDYKTIQGYVSIAFQEEGEYAISLPAILRLSLTDI